MNPYTQFIYNSSAGSASTEATPRSTADLAGGDSNVFSDWLLLMQELTYSPRGPVSITFVQDETLPVGDWDLADVTLRGNGTGQSYGVAAPAAQIVVTIPDGCTFSSWRFGAVEAGLRLKSTSTAPVVTFTGTGQLVVVLNYGFIESTTAPFFRVAADADEASGPTLSLSVSGGGGIIDGGYEVVEGVTGGANNATIAIVMAGESAWVDAGTVRGEAIYGQLVQHPAVADAVLPAQANLTNVFDFGGLSSLAKLIAYTPTTAADWTDSTPASLATAIDELAARIAVLEP